MAVARRRSEFVAKRAEDIFGADLVKDAFVCVQYVEGVTKPEEIPQRLDRAVPRVENQYGAGLSFDAEEVQIVFTNGRTVSFSGSEWASMSLVTEPCVEA